ncbi:hypothetical protein [Helicobacter sp. 23-1045]
MKDNAYHIVFCCDDNYVKYCAVCMQSIVESIAESSEKFGEKSNRGGAE